MPETQKETLHCPVCGAPISAVLQQLTAWSIVASGEVKITEDKSHLSLDNVIFEHLGQTYVDWDGLRDHPEGTVKCENDHIVQLKDCEVRKPAPKPFPYVEATVKRELIWDAQPYLDYCVESGETPTGDGFVSWVRQDMEDSGDFPNDDVHNFSVELKRRPTP